MDIQELEEITVTNEDKEEFGSDEDQEIVDLHDAFILLNKCNNLLCYMSDADLCHDITKRERRSMITLANKIREYLDEAEPAYSEA